jgi:hypothetical protein
MYQSIERALREGTWRRVSGGWLARLAAVAVVADVLTTAYIFYAPAYGETNLLLAWLSEVHPALSVAVFAGYSLVHLAIAWLSLGWFSPVVGTFLVVVMGLAGLNNLVLFGTGMTLYSVFGVPATLVVHAIKPAIGIALGLVIARRRGPLPWHEVAVLLTPGVAVVLATLVL